MVRCQKWALMVLVFTAGVITPVTMAQQAPSAGVLYSTWIGLSLRGLNQAEIESLVGYMGPERIAEVKERLRNTVLANLESKRVRQRFLASRDSDDLNGLLTTIETELRFAGLTHDDEIRLRIRNRFGIPVGGN